MTSINKGRIEIPQKSGAQATAAAPASPDKQEAKDESKKQEGEKIVKQKFVSVKEARKASAK